MLAAGDQACVMEATSMASVKGRLDGTRFAVLVFTNLTQDHLDFHGTMEAYFDAKAILFRDLSGAAVAVLNADDPHARRLRSLTKARVVTFGQSEGADVRLASVQAAVTGTGIVLMVAAGLGPEGGATHGTAGHGAPPASRL